MGNLKQIIEDVDTMIRTADSHMAEAKALDVKDRYHTYALGLASVKGMIEGLVQELEKRVVNLNQSENTTDMWVKRIIQEELRRVIRGDQV